MAMFERNASLPPRRITALAVLRQSTAASAVTLGRFVNDHDDAEGHTLFDDKSVEAACASRSFADRIGQRGPRGCR